MYRVYPVALFVLGLAGEAGATEKLASSRTLGVGPVVLAYCGYIGGASSDSGMAIAVDTAGNAYVTGQTQSDQTTFPVAVGPDLTYTPGVFMPDAFVAKVKADGTGLDYAGYIGGAGHDYGYAIAVDAAGSAYIGGLTDSNQLTFPVSVGPDLTYNGTGLESDAYVAKVKADGTALVYAGYIGGNAADYANGIAVDTNGNAYLTGLTGSDQSTFPLIVGPDLTRNGGEAFVSKVTADGTGLVYSGYIGGKSGEVGYGVAVDATGSAYVTGATFSTQATFPVTIGPDLTFNDTGTEPDGFVVKVKADGTGFDYAGYIGGARYDQGNRIALDAAGDAYVSGRTASDQASFPVIVGPDSTFNGPAGDYDTFVAKVAADGTGLDYAGYIGGSGFEDALGIAVDAAGNAYVSGATASDETTFPVIGGPDLTFNGGGGDGFVAKVKSDGTGLVYAGYIGGGGEDDGYGIAVDATGNAYVVGATASDESTFPVTVGPDLTFNGGNWDGFVAKVAMTCLLGGLVPPAVLVGVKDGAGGARFAWGPDPKAPGYHLNTVPKKDYLRETNPTSPRQMPIGQGETQCSTPALGCTDSDAIADPRKLLFYQVLSACGSTGADEGPVCTVGAPCP